MHIFDNLRSCVTRKYNVKKTPTRIYFGVKIVDAFKSDDVPSQLKSLLVYIAREGVAVTDLFRRPGNPQDMKRIISDLENGVKIDWRSYNFYTLANISKRFLLHINGGLLGAESEDILIRSLDSKDDQTRIEAMYNVIISQPKKVQRLMALYFGIWFRMIYHTEVNAMSVEAVAKSVAGSVFPSTCSSPQKVEKASKVMEYLITGFASADLFGKELIEYFTYETRTSISRVEKFKYEFLFPIDVPREKSTRLFMRMLVAEAKKHGFDVIKNVVSKEVFEASNWNYAFNNELNEESFEEKPKDENYLKTNQTASMRNNTNANYSPLNNDHHLENTPTINSNNNNNENYKENVPPPNRPNKPIILGHGPGEVTTTRSHQVKKEAISSPDSSYIQTMTTMTSATLTPKLDRHASFTKKSTSNLALMNRSASIKESRNASISGKKKNMMLSRNTSSSSRIHPVQQFCEKRTCVTAASDGKYDSQQSVHRLDRTNLPSYPNSGLKTSTSEHGCFNSVKKRQMERLQKRSDWFLSPPVGVRSSVLMQIDPGCCHLPNNDIVYYQHNKPLSNLSLTSSPNNNNPQDTHANMSQQQSPDDNYSMCDDLSYFNNNNNNNTNTNTNNHITTMNSDEIMNDYYNRFPIASSPLQSSETFYESNNRHVEVRYFVVERYYGHEPRPNGANGANDANWLNNKCQLTYEDNSENENEEDIYMDREE